MKPWIELEVGETLIGIGLSKRTEFKYKVEHISYEYGTSNVLVYLINNIYSDSIKMEIPQRYQYENVTFSNGGLDTYLFHERRLLHSTGEVKVAGSLLRLWIPYVCRANSIIVPQYIRSSLNEKRFVDKVFTNNDKFDLPKDVMLLRKLS